MDRDRRFLVIGVGGIGTHLAHGLARQLEYGAPGQALILIDGDTFESKNKERQIFKQMGNKAESLAYELGPDFPQTMIIPQAKWVVAETEEGEEPEIDPETEQPTASKIAAKDLLSDWDVVYAVVDNDACRRVLMDAAAELDNVDLFCGGNDDQLFGSVYHYQRRGGEDITTNPSQMHEQYKNPKDRNPGDLSCQERAELEGGTQLIATNSGVATFLLGRTQAVILNEQERLDENNPDEIYFDLGLGLAQSMDRSVRQLQTQER